MWTGHDGHGQILEAAGAREGRGLAEGLAYVGAESGWRLLCTRKPCFHGSCSVRAGPEAEQRAGCIWRMVLGVIRVSCALFFNDAVVEGNLTGPDPQGENMS